MNQRRPPLLNALCFLSISGGIIAFFGYFLTSLYFEKASKIIITYSSLNSTEQLNPFFFTLLMALYGLSIAGVIRIWKFHRDGFFIYLVVQLLILFMPVFWMGWHAYSITNTIFTLVFLGGYTLFFKILK